MFTYEKFYDDVYLKEYVSEIISVDDSVDAAKLAGSVQTVTGAAKANAVVDAAKIKTADGKIDSAAIGKIDSATTGKIDSATTGKIDSATTGKIDSATTGKIDSAATGKIDSATTGKIDSATTGKVGTTIVKTDSVGMKSGTAACMDGTIVAVELKETIFFPEGGGQSSDTGTINNLPVIHVRKKEGHIYHYVLCPQGSDVSKLLQVGMTAKLSIDWDRRFDNMQRHCGEHILSGVFFREYGGVNKGFHMGHDYMTIDIDFEKGSEFKEVTAEMAAHAELCANQVIWANAPVSRVVFDDLESAKKLPLRKSLTIESDISVVTIGDASSPADCVACCGTHPSTAGQVGLIKILKVEPNKGMSRVYCEAGGRAHSDYCKKHDIIMRLCNRYSAVPATLQEQMARDDEKIKAVRTELHVLKQSVIRQRSEAILKDIENDARISAGSSGGAGKPGSVGNPMVSDAGNSRGAGARNTAKSSCGTSNIAGKGTNAVNTALVPAKDKIYIYEYNDLKADDVFAIGRAISASVPKLLLLISAPDNTVFLISDGTTCNCGMLVKDNAHIYNGKGGGKADNARAIFPNREGLDTFIDLLEKHLR